LGDRDGFSRTLEKRSASRNFSTRRLTKATTVRASTSSTSHITIVGLNIVDPFRTLMPAPNFQSSHLRHRCLPLMDTADTHVLFRFSPIQLRYATPDKRSFTASSGLGCCHSGTVRYKCSSTEYRTRTETAGKKTSLNPAAGARKPAEPETLTSAYEDLRRPSRRVFAFWRLGNGGMDAACSWVASTNPDNSRRCPTTAAPFLDELRGEIVLVLAAMALKQAPEVYP